MNEIILTDIQKKQYLDALELIEFYMYKMSGTEIDYLKGDESKMFSDIKQILLEYKTKEADG